MSNESVRNPNIKKSWERQQYTFYGPDAKAGKLQVGTKVENSLPRGAGYDEAGFRNDILNVFKNTERVATGEVIDTWENHVLYKGNEFNANARYVSLSDVNEAATSYELLYDKLEKSCVKDALLGFNGGNVQDAAQTFLEWCEYHARQSKCPEQLPQDIMEAMEKLEQNKDFQKMQAKVKGGIKPGDKHEPLTPAQMRVLELLPKVRKKYEFAACKSHVYEPCFFPEDDVDIRNMETFGEIMRVPKPILGCEDDEFYLRVATKQFPVLEFKRAIPMPKKFVICIDVSSSMKRPLEDGYRRQEYAQATAIALAEQAEAGGNSCEVIFFGASAFEKDILTGTPKEIQVALFKKTVESGGTSFEAAFRAADKRKADHVVLVSDGQGSFERAPQVPLMTLICGNDEEIYGGRGFYDALQRVSYRFDRVV